MTTAPTPLLGSGAALPRPCATRSPVRLRTAAVAALMVVAAAGCAAVPDSSHPSSTGAQQWSPGALAPDPPHRPVIAATSLPPELGPVDRNDPDATARAALIVWFAWNTNTDSTPLDAAARATPLLSPELATQVCGTAPVIGPGQQWNRWAQAHAIAAVQVDASPETVPPQTDTEAIRVYVVTERLYDPVGHLIDTVEHTVGVLLRRDKVREWEVNRVDDRGR